MDAPALNFLHRDSEIKLDFHHLTCSRIHLLQSPSARSLQAVRDRKIQCIEEQLETPMRLRTVGQLVAEEEHMALADVGADDLDALVHHLLSPRPATAERRFAREPADDVRRRRTGVWLRIQIPHIAVLLP